MLSRFVQNPPKEGPRISGVKPWIPSGALTEQRRPEDDPKRRHEPTKLHILHSQHSKMTDYR